MNKKMIRTLIILGVFLVVGIAATVAIPKIIRNYKQLIVPDANESPATLINRSDSEVTQIHVKNATGEYDLVLQTNNQWRLMGAESVTLDSTMVSSIVHDVAFMKGSDLVYQGRDRLADFGFDAPKAEVTATYKDGTTTTILVGNDSPDTIYVYAMLAGDDRVVSIPAATAYRFATAADKFRSLEIINVNPELVNKTTITLRDNVVIAIEKVEKGTYFGSNISTTFLTKPYVQPANTEIYNQLLATLCSLEFSNLEEVNPSDLAQYGLDKPQMVIEVDAQQKLGFKLTVGATTALNTYVMLESSKTVYAVGNANVNFLGITPMSLTNRVLNLVLIHDVKTIVAEGLGRNDTVALTHTPEKNSDGTEQVDKAGNVQYSQAYKLNGNDLKKEDGIAWYKALMGVFVQDALPKDYTVSGTPVASVTFNLSDTQYPTRVIKFYDYDLDNYVAEVDGEAQFVVRKNSVQKSFTIAKEIEDGTFVAPED